MCGANDIHQASQAAFRTMVEGASPALWNGVKIVLNQPVWERGHLLPPTAPGLGIEFDREAAKRYPFRQVELPQLRLADGSFTNW